jgi:phage portal protein BeeE
LKLRNVYGDVLALWYVPNFCITPRYPFDGSRFIDYYDYRPGTGQPLRLPPRDLVHFRMALDPNDLRRGFSPLRSLLREIATDDEASAFSAHILRNLGVPGLLISPKDAALRPSPEDLEKMKQYIKTEFTGDKRGGTMVMGLPTAVEQFGLDPSKLMVPDLRDVSEERVCAVLGIPAAVVGFGSGNQSTKVGATMRELRRLAFVNCLAPNQNIMAKQITRQLMPDFVAQTRRFRVVFDQSGVAAFTEDENLKAERVCREVQTGVLRIDRAQELLGLEVDPNMQVYLRPTNSVAIDDQGKVLPSAAPGATPPNPPAIDPALTPAVADPAAGAQKAEDALLAAIAARVGMVGLPGNGNGDR